MNNTEVIVNTTGYDQIEIADTIRSMYKVLQRFEEEGPLATIGGAKTRVIYYRERNELIVALALEERDAIIQGLREELAICVRERNGAFNNGASEAEQSKENTTYWAG